MPTAAAPTRTRTCSAMGEGLIGQTAVDARPLLITEVPSNVTPIRSGLYEMRPANLIILPVLFEGQVKAVIELASVSPFTGLQKTFLDQLTGGIGIVLNSIEATMQTEGLLKQSQQLAGELQTQQKELQLTNEQLEQKAQQLAEQNAEVETQEPGNRAGAPRAGGEGVGARADLEIQVRIPRQHVARAAHAAQQHPDSRPAARRQSRRQSVGTAGRVRAHDPRRRHRSVEPHQRHSRSLQDRVRHRVRRRRGHRAAAAGGIRWRGRSGTRRSGAGCLSR